ncbi:MAG: hypothetical protein P4M14_11610, partial [Gammaproteobacteria bacterium]|nr:hypothetical protein [Gammaproteobacteria bacterium]
MRFQKWISASLLFFTSLFLFCSTAFAHMILITATSPFPIQLNTSSVTNATFTVTNIASQIPITVIDQSQFPAGLSIKNTTCGSLIAPHQSCIITLQLQAPAQPVLISTELREKASPSADGVQFPIIINVVAATVPQLTVTPIAGTNGTISPSSKQLVNKGGNLTFSATPNAGYKINQWLLDGSAVQTGGANYTLSNITVSHTVQATFAVNQYTVTPSAGSNGTISPNTPQTVVNQGALTFNATPTTGYSVNQWLVDG